MGCFNDFPQGLRGKYDNVHDNLWEEWLELAFNTQGLPINSYNSLWVTFLHIDASYENFVLEIVEKLLQSLYVLQPQLEGVLFLKRGESEDSELDYVDNILNNHFFNFKLQNSDILRNLIGINSRSRVYYSPKTHVNESMEIRMAREEDHDDLA